MYGLKVKTEEEKERPLQNPFTYRTISGASITVERPGLPYPKGYGDGFFNPDIWGRDRHSAHYIKDGKWLKMPKDTIVNGKLALDFGGGNVETFSATFKAALDEDKIEQWTKTKCAKEIDEKRSIQRFNTPEQSTNSTIPEKVEIVDSPEPAIHVSVKAPEQVKAMTGRQSYALYLISGRDWRKSSIKLSIIQASCLIRAGNALKRKAA